MESTTISLCLTYPRIKEPDKNMKFRIADKIGNSLKKVNFNTDEVRTRVIFSRPTDGTPLNAELVKWWYDYDDPQKTWSEVDETQNVYEIVLNEDYYDKWRGNHNKVISDLKKGIHLSKGLTKSFFMVIDETLSFYKCILCETKDLKNDIYRLNIESSNFTDTTHTLGVFNIQKKSIIDTRDLFIMTEDDNLVDRQFYNSLELPTKSDDITIFTIKDFTPYLLKKYLKNKKNKFEFTNTQVKNIVFLINEFIKDQGELENIIELTGKSYNQIKIELDNLEFELGEFLNDTSDIDMIVENSIRKNDEYILKIKETIENKMLLKKNSEIIKLDIKLNNVSELLRKKTEEIKMLDDKKLIISNVIIDLNKNVDELRLEAGNFKAEINGLLKNYSREAIRLFGNMEFLKNINQEELVSLKSNFSIVEGEKFDVISPELDDFQSYIDDLAHNLECIGISELYSKDLAVLLVVLMKLSIPLIIPEIIARKIANAISYITNNKYSTIIRIQDYDLTSSDIMKIRNLEERILYVDNYAEDMKESNLLKLATIKEKLVVIPFKDSSVTRLISDAIYDYCTLIDLDKHLDIELDEDYYYGKTLDEVFDVPKPTYGKSKKIFTDYSSKIHGDKIRKSNLIKHSRIKEVFINVRGKDSRLLINEICLLDDSIEESRLIGE